MINLSPANGGSLHEQIEAEFKRLIIDGILEENAQLPSVRELSLSLTVNPNTVQRAYKTLEADGFIYSIKGKGSFVSRLPSAANIRLSEEALSRLRAAARELAFLGAEKAALLSAIDEAYSDKEGNDI